jgi:hypothetical protein
LSTEFGNHFVVDDTDQNSRKYSQGKKIAGKSIHVEAYQDYISFIGTEKGINIYQKGKID